MPRDHRTDELLTLKEIAETLNSSNDTGQMLHAVLQKLLEVTGLATGWIFLADERPDYICAADHRLPPALSWGGKAPMNSDTCWCLGRYWDGELPHAVNIINCKRIENAVKYRWGDTAGITHHATIPLEAGGERFGLLNVAAPHKTSFSPEELALLQSVAYQIGTAVKRTRLYQAQQKRAEQYAKSAEIARRLAGISEVAHFPAEAVRQIGRSFDWPVAAFFVKEQQRLSLRALLAAGRTETPWLTVPPQEAGPVGEAFRLGRPVLVERAAAAVPQLTRIGVPRYGSAAAVPLNVRDETVAVLFAASETSGQFDENDLDVLAAMADHIALAMEHARLGMQKRELVRMEERNRLARDLHDSVCQTLFSLTLTARGAEALLHAPEAALRRPLREIQELSDAALKEMRSLVWQLRPLGLEDGLVTALKRYAANQGLVLHDRVEGVVEPPRAVEEALWRIGQEAINNVKKHAGTAEIKLELELSSRAVRMRLSDEGQGFAPAARSRSPQPGGLRHDAAAETDAGAAMNAKAELTVPELTDSAFAGSSSEPSFGLRGMRERAEMLGGSLRIESSPGRGAAISVTIPLRREQG